MDGIIPLYKERGMTSHDCVNQLRKILHTKKIGHSGTLDPNVDGVLPICIGKATKVVEYLMASGKQYRGQLLIGKMTTTEDLDGEVVETASVDRPVEVEKIEHQMQTMTGLITQIPPMYSAVKVNGRKLYEYARAGETVVRPERQVMITKFELTSSHYDSVQHQQTVSFVVECSKGTYVRTLAVDLARHLGYPGVMSDLTRLKSGGFSLDQAKSLAEIEAAVATDSLNEIMFPLDYALDEFPRVTITGDIWAGVKNGIWLKLSEVPVDDPIVAIEFDHQIRALYQKNTQHACYQPLKMLNLD